jgi:hypothetical protein
VSAKKKVEKKTEIKREVGQVLEISGETVTILFEREVRKGNKIAIAIGGNATIDFGFDGLVIRDTKTGILTEKESVNAGDKARFALLGALICQNAKVYIKIPAKPLIKGTGRR